MAYRAECSVCEFESEVDDLEAVLDLQADHRAEAGERHLFEFEKRER